MKKLLSLLAITSLLFASCSSDGPQGPPGPPGADGVNIVGQAFEVEVDFIAPDYSIFAEFPSNVEVLDSDVVLVYWLEAVDDGTDVWSLIPQTIYFSDGEFQYNYNHTDFDVNIYLQGNIDLGTLGTRYTQDQIFKIVVLPVDYASNSGIDLSNYENLKANFDIQELDIQEVNIH
ncbi:collagen-like protein [Christiangramia aquimixticola]|uniref:collagen-like protein n=1 Tax=Christiangramia aquimixticola TaxID=1697558 RepID=UPI003AA7C9C0